MILETHTSTPTHTNPHTYARTYARYESRNGGAVINFYIYREYRVVFVVHYYSNNPYYVVVTYNAQKG